MPNLAPMQENGRYLHSTICCLTSPSVGNDHLQPITLYEQFRGSVKYFRSGMDFSLLAGEDRGRTSGEGKALGGISGADRGGICGAGFA